MGAYMNPQLPALDVKQPPSPLDQMAKVQQLRNLQQASQLGQQQVQAATLENQQRQQTIKDQQALTTALKSWDGQDYGDLTKGVLANGGSGNVALQIQQHALGIKKQVSDIAKSDSETGSKNLETYIGKHKAIGDALEGIEQVPDNQLHDAAMAKVNDLTKGGMIDPQTSSQLLQSIQATQDPAALRSQIDIFAKNSMGAKAVAEQAKQQAEATGAQAKGEQEQRANYATQLSAATNQQDYEQRLNALPHGIAKQFPAQFDKDAVLAAGMTPHEVASLPVDKIQMKDWLQKNPGKTPSDYVVWKAQNSPQMIVQANQLQPGSEGLDLAARNYLMTGQIPAGMTRSPQTTAAIINRAGELGQGQDIFSNKAVLDANRSSLAAIQKNRDAVVAFENTSLKNLDLFLEQAKKVVDTGSPLINTPVRSISKAMGGTNYPAYQAARQVAINEIAKVTSNPGLTGVLSDEARREVAAFNPDNATLAQSYRVAGVLKQDMANRHQSYDQQIADIQQRIRGGGQQQGAPQGGQGQQQQGGDFFSQFPKVGK